MDKVLKTTASKKGIDYLASEWSLQIFTFPWPPTANTYWRHNRGRHHIATRGVQYRRYVATTLMLGGFKPLEKERISIYIEAFPPDKRRRDLDNINKALLDSMQYAGLFEDDSQIDDLHIIRRQRTPVGQVVVHIRAICQLNA